MVTDEEAVRIATKLAQEKIKEPWKFHSVHLVDPLEIIRTATDMTPQLRQILLARCRKQWMVLFDLMVGVEGQTPMCMEPGALRIGVDIETGAAHIEEFVK